MTATLPASIDARYGRTPSKRRRDRWIYVLAGIAVGIVVLAWVVWAGLDESGSTLETQDVGTTTISANMVQINYQVSMPAGQTASCALQVQNAAHAIVGWKIVKVPASQRYTNGYSTLVRSAEPPVTGLIYQCWLT